VTCCSPKSIRAVFSKPAQQNKLGTDMSTLESLQEIRAISFDGDGTLWDFEQVMRRSLQRVLDELSQIDPDTASLLSIEKMISIRKTVGEELTGKMTNLETIRLEAFKRTLQIVGKPDDCLAAYLNQRYYRFKDISLFDDVMPTLKELNKKFKLGLLSNGNSYPERCGLEGIFEFVVFSQDHGIEKPDPEIFKIALIKAACSPKQLLHVGDSLSNDVQGAANAGITGIWLNRNSTINPGAVSPDYEIKSLTELLEIL
jgi:FMN hydrolase / 5-amino-6-(5-phospho-D-ribitylamino)uracil phosphatase